MTTTLPQSAIEQRLSAFPGFSPIEKIGVGGYGEVWKVRAPDGTFKAVKSVYGSIDEQRAARELKSLGRIREVRHPHLLSIEAVEVVQGQLFILSELADSCLQDVFEAYRAAGRPGIPLDELLEYLRETASTLDYLYERHSLQHLDVKPGNLLLLAGHVKVADFGLLKDLHDNGVSLVNGLTPKYAAPEVFNGRPSRYSDQYSLAIVFQELLTGKLPFDGVSAAHLASQHLHSPPDLAGLSPQYRFAVGKALAKEPERRFRSCSELVERLARPRSSAMVVEPSAVPAGHPEQQTAAEPRGDTWRHDGRTVVVAQPDVVTLPAPQVDFTRQAYRPTLFIGLGGLAGKVLRKLRRKLDDRFENSSGIPSLGMLYIDTDVASINEALAPDTDGTLRQDEVLLLPLRKSQEYRERSFAVSPSLSRRWIYNMPRSLRTEGLRALGRIALLDHSQRVLERLRTLVTSATDAESLAQTTRNSGLDFSVYDPQVYIVSSITGGTGGGMLLDMAYAVRQVLTEMGLSDEAVHGILPLPAWNGSKGRQLAAANAYACLSELHYFATENGDYPGEPACGLAGFREGKGTFAGTYLIGCGEDLTEAKLADLTQQMAEYLFLAGATPAQKFFDACREEAAESGGDRGLQVRSFGLATLGSSGAAISRGRIEALCQAVIRKWRGGIDAAANDSQIKLTDLERLFEHPDRNSQVSEFLSRQAARTLAGMSAEIDPIRQHLAAAAEAALGGDSGGFFRKVIGRTLEKSRPNCSPHQQLQEALHVVQLVVGNTDAAPGEGQGKIEVLREVLLAEAHQLAGELGQNLREWVLHLVDGASTRLTGARQTAMALDRQVELLRDQASVLAAASRQELEKYSGDLAELIQNAKFGRQGSSDQLRSYAEHYALLALDDVVKQAVTVVCGAIESHLSQASDELRELWSDLNQLMRQFSNGRTNPASESTDSTPDSDFSFPLELIEVVEQLLETHFFKEQHSLRKSLTENRESRDSLIAHMCDAARKALLQHQKMRALQELSDGVKHALDHGMGHAIHEAHRAATPGLLDIGGAKRMLLVVPQEVDRRKAEAETARVVGESPTTLELDDGDLRMVYEVEQLPLEGVFGTLLRLSPDCRDLARRLHTRIDIDW